MTREGDWKRSLTCSELLKKMPQERWCGSGQRKWMQSVQKCKSAAAIFSSSLLICPHPCFAIVTSYNTACFALVTSHIMPSGMLHTPLNPSVFITNITWTQYMRRHEKVKIHEKAWETGQCADWRKKSQQCLLYLLHSFPLACLMFSVSGGSAEDGGVTDKLWWCMLRTAGPCGAWKGPCELWS
jgi:hypothetical protein